MPTRQTIKIGGRLWFAAAEPGSIGRGRIELLQHIAQTGSISQAARTMGMSYKAAWDAVYPLLWTFFAIALPLPLVLGLASRRQTVY